MTDILKEENIDISVRKMNDIMQRKLSLLYEMRNLSEQAYNYVSEDTIEPLNNIIEQKQAVIDEIDTLDDVFLTEFNSLKTGLGLSTIQELEDNKSPQLKNLRMNTADILDIMQKIAALDDKFNKSLIKLRENVSADLARIRKQKQVSGMYENDGSGQGTRQAQTQRAVSPARANDPARRKDPAQYPPTSGFDKKK